ncbi:MAG: mechanosensitive ion channel domain-containing protein [Syntrophobacteria bacterium]
MERVELRESERVPSGNLFPAFIRRPLCMVTVFFLLILKPNLFLTAPEAMAKENKAQVTTQQNSSSDLDLSTAEEKVKELDSRLTGAEKAINELTAKQLEVTLSELQERAVKIRDLETIYQRLVNALKRRATLEKDEALLREKVKSQEQVGITQQPPYSLSFYDGFLDQLAATEQKKEISRQARKLARTILEDALSRLEEWQQTLRLLKEEKEKESPETVTAKLNWELENAQIELELAQAMQYLQKINVQNLSTEIRLADLQLEVDRRNIDWVRKHLSYDKDDLEKHLSGLEQTRTDLQKLLKSQLREQMKAEAVWLRAEKRLSSAKEESEITLAAAELAASEAWREASRRSLEQTEEMLQLLSLREKTWNYRYALINGGDIGPEKLDSWREEIEASISNIQRSVRLQESYQTGVQTKIAVLEKRLAEPDLNAKVRQELNRQMLALRTLSQGNFEYLSALLATGKLQQHLLDEIDARGKRFDLSNTITVLAGKLRGVWDYELWVIDERSVSVKKVAMAFLILVLGLALVRITVRLIATRFLPRTHLKTTTAAAIGKVLNYVAILLIVLLALRWVNIPLTLFAFLGGAVAIGVGFGAQNLINNFISGFIMMAEQPIKIGDLVEVDNHFAVVEEIGARCTRIRTGANIHILVPNSSFLEKSIVNWTLSDRKIRTRVIVGVVYGSPVSEVERLLIQAAMEHKKVLRTPEPFVLFNDFGDNALIFEIHFWISISRLMERLMIESAIRFRIDDLFRAAGIVIAFPQRDVHLDTQRPLELRIVDTEGTPESRKD